MITTIETRNWYTFEELDKNAKDNAWTLATSEDAEQIGWTIGDAAADKLNERGAAPNEYAPHGVQWDVSGSQGGGVNLYGTWTWNQLARAFDAGCILDDCDDFDITIQANRRGTYCKWYGPYYRDDLAMAFTDEMGDARPYGEVLRAADIICDGMQSICSDLRDLAEHTIYEWYTEPGAHDCYYYTRDGEERSLRDEVEYSNRRRECDGEETAIGYHVGLWNASRDTWDGCSGGARWYRWTRTGYDVLGVAWLDACGEEKEWAAVWASFDYGDDVADYGPVIDAATACEAFDGVTNPYVRDLTTFDTLADAATRCDRLAAIIGRKSENW